MKERADPRIGLVAAAGMLLRLALLLRSPVYLDRLFIPDDTYYTLTIARSIARGLGPTADGTHLTSGFQPLLAFLLVPFANVTWALAIGAVSDGLTAWFLSRLALRAHGSALAAALIWALSPSAIATSLNGLETSLAIACMTGALVAWNDRRAWTGAVLGLCLLARVDTVFLVTAIGVATWRRDGLKRAFTFAGSALAVVAPWWTYALFRFGSVIPESGAAVREQAMMYRAAGMVVRDQVAWATAAVVGPPFIDVRALRELLGSTASALGLLVGILLVAGALYSLRKRPDPAVAILTVHAICIFLFYALYLPATWFFRRYLVPIHVLVALLVAVRVRHRLWLAWVPVAIVALVPFFFSTPSMTLDQEHHGAKGYREPALQILALAPKDAVIGSFQSGALGWFASGDQHVVNLDGVVDGEAARAVRERRIATFARSRNVTHLADWDVNARLFVERSSEPRPTLVRIGEAEPQGARERFVLYRIDY